MTQIKVGDKYRHKESGQMFTIQQQVYGKPGLWECNDDFGKRHFIDEQYLESLMYSFQPNIGSKVRYNKCLFIFQGVNGADENKWIIQDVLGMSHSIHKDKIEIVSAADTPDLKPGMRVITKDGKRTYTFVDYDGEYLSCDDETGHQYFFKRDQIEPVEYEPVLIASPPQDNVKEQQDSQEFLDKCLLAAMTGLISSEFKPSDVCEEALSYAKSMLQIRNQNLLK